MSSRSRWTMILVSVGIVAIGLVTAAFWRLRGSPEPARPVNSPHDSPTDALTGAPKDGARRSVSAINADKDDKQKGAAKQREAFLKQLHGMVTGPREKQLEHRKSAYSKSKESKEWRQFLRDAAEGKVKGVSREERFHAATLIAGFGHPSRLGPNFLRDMRLGAYLAIQKSLRPYYSPEERHIALDPKLDDLRVTVEPNESNDLTLQEILWTLIKKYKLTFELRDGKTFYLTAMKKP